MTRDEIFGVIGAIGAAAEGAKAIADLIKGEPEAIARVMQIPRVREQLSEKSESAKAIEKIDAL